VVEGLNTVAIALVPIIIGYLILYFINLRLSSKAKRRELILTYLIEAYTAMERCAFRKLGTELEDAVATVQLFGTKKQIELAKQMAIDLTERKQADFDELLLDLRNSLRRELRLKEYEGGIVHLRTTWDRTI